MQKRNNLLTFLAALVPGVGYMSLGLVKKGVQILVIFLLIGPVCKVLGLSFLGELIKIPLWFYTFFDTFNIASRMDRGEIVNDSDFIFKKYTEPGSVSSAVKTDSKSLWMVLAWVLIGAGVLAIINQMFNGSEVYGMIKSYISMYFIPVLLVIAGLYMLLRNKL